MFRKEYYEEYDGDDEDFDEDEIVVPHGRKRSFIGRILSIVVSLAVILFCLYSLAVLRYISDVSTVGTGERFEHGVQTMQDDEVRNILLIGSDTRSISDKGRADTVILLSINSRTKDLYVTSFMRDSYVDVPGHGFTKLNASYRYGGAELLMDTLEVNFKVDIDEYVYVNFDSFSKIVDAVGGIELSVTDAEAEGMKPPMAEQNDLLGNPYGTDYLSGGGTYLMNGNQALAYARLRYVGNADFQRTERQREVIKKIFEKAKTLPIGELDSFLSTCASSITTNMSKKDMYFLSLRLLSLIKYDFNELRIPCDDGYTGSMIGGQSVLEIDFDKNISLIKDKVYG